MLDWPKNQVTQHKQNTTMENLVKERIKNKNKKRLGCE